MELRFEICTPSDFDDYYALRCEEENVAWTGHKEAPNKEKIREWFLAQLVRDDRIFFIVRDRESSTALGYLYIDLLGENRNIMETGHGVSSSMKGRGLGTAIIKFAVDYTVKNITSVDRIDGWIARDNVGSIKNVLKNGYHETKDTKSVYFEAFGKEVEMVRYELLVSH